MGCGASKRTTVAPAEDDAVENGSTKHKQTSDAKNAKDADRVDSATDGSNDAKPPQPVAQPMAFEVPAHEESLIRKHPPKRFLRLEDQPSSLTHELLDEKQAEAEERRRQILTQRIQSARQRVPRRPFTHEDGESPTEMETTNRDNTTEEI